MPDTSLARLVEGLILSPSSLDDHRTNLVKCLLHPELVIERQYRAMFPDLTHEQYILIRNDPELINHVRDEIRASEGVSNYVQMLKDAAARGLAGDLNHKRWYCGELDLSQEQQLEKARLKEGTLSYQKMIGDVSSAVRQAVEVKQKPKVIDAQAEVK